MERRWRRSLQVKFSLVVGYVAVFSIMVLTASQAYVRVQQIQAQILDQNLSTARLLAVQVEGAELSIEHELGALAATPWLADELSAGDSEALSAWLETIAPFAPDLMGLAILDRDGVTRGTSRQSPSALGTSLANERQVRDALDHGIPSTGAPRRGLATGDPVVPIAVPIPGPGGTPGGTLLGTWSLGRVSEQVQRVPIGETGYVSIMGPDDLILAHPDPAVLLTPDPALQRIVASTRQGGSFFAETVDSRGARVYAAAVPIPRLGWTVVAELPLDEAYAPLQAALLRVSTVALAVMVLAVVVGVLMARRLSFPLGQLRNATRQLAQGTYVPGSLAIHSGDEIEELAHDFGSMATQLAEDRIALKERADQEAYQRAQLAALLNAITEAVVFVDAEQHITVANRRAEELFGLDATDISLAHTGDASVVLSRGMDQPEVLAQLIRGHAADEEHVFSELLATRPPEARDLALYSAPVQRLDGRFLGRIYIFRDVTIARRTLRSERVAVEQALRESLTREQEARLAAEAAVRVRDEFVSVAAHELKTPLTSLQLGVDLLTESADGTRTMSEEATRPVLELIHTQTGRLSGLVSRLLDFSRIELGRLSIDRTSVDLVDLVGGVVEHAQARTRDHALTLQAPRTLVASVDPLRFEQVVVNLVDNAIKYSPNGGPILVELAEAEGTISLAVTDQGLGIPAEQRAHIFERYYQAHTEDYVSGLGLGLYISRQIVEQHGGEIRVEFPSAVGSRFVVTMPTAPPSMPAGDA